jgi:pyrophosphatase PpaX
VKTPPEAKNSVYVKIIKIKVREKIIMIKAVLFDLDGTLIDTNNLIIESFKHTLKTHLNICPSDNELISYFGEPLKYTMARYDKNNVDKLCRTFFDFSEVVHDEMTLEIEGTKDILKVLGTLNIKTGIVTSKRRKMAERGLKLFELYDFMDVIVTLEDTENHKPCPEPLIKACEAIGVKPENVLFVGDSHFDILCGKNAGAKTCLVSYTAMQVDDIIRYKPDYTIDRLGDILKLLDIQFIE